MDKLFTQPCPEYTSGLKLRTHRGKFVNVESGETRKAAAGCVGRIVRAAVWAAAALLLYSTAFAQASGSASLEEIAARFPDASRVVADYYDDSSRYAALTVLLNSLPRGRATYEKSFTYSQTSNQIVAKYASRGVDPQVRKYFDDRASQLIRDPNFKRGVLERYKVADLAAVRQPAPAQGHQPTYQDPSAFTRRAVPIDQELLLGVIAAIWIGTLVVMALLPMLVQTLTGCLADSGPAEAGASTNPLQLPESLRDFKLAGERYILQMVSAQVIEVKTRTFTYNTVVNTVPSVAYVGGQQVLLRGGQRVESHTGTSDRVWVRTVDGAELDWEFVGDVFPTRQGQIVSSIDRDRGNGQSGMFFVYNHATGRFTSFFTGHPSQKIGILLPAIVSALVGTVGFLLGAAVLFQLRIGLAAHAVATWPFALTVAIRSDWIYCVVCAGIAARYFARVTRGRVQRRRDKRFWEDVKPVLIRHLQQATPVLAQHFAQAR